MCVCVLTMVAQIITTTRRTYNTTCTDLLMTSNHKLKTVLLYCQLSFTAHGLLVIFFQLRLSPSIKLSSACITVLALGVCPYISLISAHMNQCATQQCTWNFKAELTLTANVCHIRSLFLPHDTLCDASRRFTANCN